MGRSYREESEKNKKYNIKIDLSLLRLNHYRTSSKNNKNSDNKNLQNLIINMAEKQIVGSDIIAQIIGIDVRRVQQLTKQGYLHTISGKTGTGQKYQYELLPTIKDAFNYYQKCLNDKGMLSPELEDLKQSKIKAQIKTNEINSELQALKLELKRGNLIPAEEIELELGNYFVTHKKFIRTLPRQIMNRLAPYIDADKIRSTEKEMLQEIDNLLRTYISLVKNK